jgi:DNA polymerase-3 subunit gamma/tau
MAVESNRVSHAYLFSGPRGCGKTSTARILARVINCENVKDGNPCNKCDSCLAVLKGTHLDVMEIDGASHTGVESVRELQESIGFTPSQGKNKVYVIDEVHMLSTHAFNALLKTLEEPPAHVYFIFATTSPQKIPDTIKSRCQRHHFKRLENGEIAGRLEYICKQEKVKFEADALRLLARKADGSMRDGTSLLDQCVTASGGNVTAQAVRGILGLIDQEKVLALVDAIAFGDATAPLKLLDSAINEGVDLNDLLSALLEGYRDLMLLSVPGDLSSLLFRSKGEVDHLRASLKSYELADLVTIVERLCNASARLKQATDPRIYFESVVVDLTLLDRQTDVRTLISRLEGGGAVGKGSAPAPRNEGTKTRGSSASTGEAMLPLAGTPAPSIGENPVRASRPAPEAVDADEDSGAIAPVSDAALDLPKVQQLWDGFVTFVRQKRVSLGVCLISGKPYAFDGARLSIRFQKSFSLQREQASRPESLEFLKQMFEKYFGKSVEILCFLEGEERAIAIDEAVAKQKPAEERLRDVSEDKKPVLQKLMQDFDGEIVRYQT